jgi:hypothetical protein
MPYIHVDLDAFSDEDILDEVDSRGLTIDGEDSIDFAIQYMVSEIFHNRRLGKDYQRNLDELIYKVIGRIV